MAARFTQADFTDEEALRRFGSEVDVATYEFENIPAGALSALIRQAPLHPPREALEIAQDRLGEKRFVEDHGGRPAPWRAVADGAGLARTIGVADGQTAGE